MLGDVAIDSEATAQMEERVVRRAKKLECRLPRVSVCVKNTFVEIEEPLRQTGLRRRVTVQ